MLVPGKIKIRISYLALEINLLFVKTFHQNCKKYTFITQCHLGLHGAPNQGWTGIRYRVVLHYSVLSEDYSKLGLQSLLH